MGRDRNSLHLSSRPGAGYFLGLSKPELFLLLLALFFYWFQPDWPQARFAQAHIRASLTGWADRRITQCMDWFDARRRLADSRGRVERIQGDLESARAEIQTLSLQVLENEALRALFSLPKETAYQYVYAEVVSRRISQQQSRIVVRTGQSRANSDSSPIPDASWRGAPVVASAQSLWVAAGQVVEVRGDLLEIMLLSDPRSRIGVASADSPALGSALLLGAGLNRLELDYVAHPHFIRQLAARMRLVTALESLFPPGLMVAELVPEGDQATGAIRLRPMPIIPFSEMKIVVILVPGKPPEEPVVP